MRPVRRTLLVVPALLALLPGVGCNTIASTLGFTPPVHKLTPAAEQFRMAAVLPAPLPKELNKSVTGAYIVEPGDTLTVEPVDLESPVRLPGNQPILIDGTIDLGKYGRPVVAGKTLAQIGADAQKLIDAQPPETPAGGAKPSTAVTVRIVGRESKVFYVLGEVNAPRAYPLAGRETVLDGLLTAGGITRQADTGKIIVSRPTRPDGCRVVLPVCYLDIVQLGDTSTNYQLQPGDRIYVPSQSGFGDGGLFGRKKNDCGPCKQPQAGCVTPGGACGDPGPTGPPGDTLLPVGPQPAPDPRATPLSVPPAAPAAGR